MYLETHRWILQDQLINLQMKMLDRAQQ